MDYYRLLGIARFEPNVAVIQRAADRQMGFVRQFQTKHPAEAARLLSELSLARITLADREKKLLYDNALKNTRTLVLPGAPAVPEAPGRAWYVQVCGIPQGPHTFDELQSLVKTREVCMDTLVQEGYGGRWVLAREVRGLFDLPTFSPPAPGTRVPEVAPLEPLTSGPDPLLGPLPEPEDRTPGPDVWVCRHCRWPVPKPKIYCPRCGYVKSVNDTRATEKGVALFLLLILAAILVLLLVNLPSI